MGREYTHTYGVDYSETFSPIAKLFSIHVFIFVAAAFYGLLYRRDLKNALAYGDLEEEVYIEQPPGFIAQRES